MVTAMCIAAEDRSNDLPQSHAMHQSCSGMAMGEEGPEPCGCFHHGMPVGGPQRKPAGRARVALTLVMAAAFLAIVVVLFR